MRLVAGMGTHGATQLLSDNWGGPVSLLVEEHSLPVFFEETLSSELLVIELPMLGGEMLYQTGLEVATHATPGLTSKGHQNEQMRMRMRMRKTRKRRQRKRKMRPQETPRVSTITRRIIRQYIE